MTRLKKQWQGREGLKAKVKKITLLLEKQYGVPRREGPGEALDILIETILSQNTNDRNRDKAFQRLKTRFPHWEDVLGGKTKWIVSAIRPGGLAEQKARRIHEILRWIKEREGRLSLSFLKKMDSEKIKETALSSSFWFKKRGLPSRYSYPSDWETSWFYSRRNECRKSPFMDGPLHSEGKVFIPAS